MLNSSSSSAVSSVSDLMWGVERWLADFSFIEQVMAVVRATELMSSESEEKTRNLLRALRAEDHFDVDENEVKEILSAMLEVERRMIRLEIDGA